MATEAYPLAWPEGWPRTRPQDRKDMLTWRKSQAWYCDSLALELKRLGAPPSFVISTNVPTTRDGALYEGRVEPADTGVAVWFNRQPGERWGWQDALDLHMPVPTEEQIQTAYRKLAKVHHPDGGGDLTMFQAVTRHRDDALRWVRRRTGQTQEYSIACDQFSAVRWNIAAIGQTLKSIRNIERCGTSALLERAFKGFQAITESASA